MNEYIDKYLSDVMFIILDKVSRLRNVDFSKVNNEEVGKIIKRFAYDILITYYHIYNGDIELIEKYIKDDLGIGIRWQIMPNKALLKTSDGVDITLEVTNEEDLSGLTATITGVTEAFEIITASEELNKTSLSIKDDSKEYKLIDRKLKMFIDGEEQPINAKVSGLNTLINLSRNINDIQTVSKR